MMKGTVLESYEGAFKKLRKLKRGDWIVRLCQPGVLNHYIMVGTSRGRILHSVEMFPIILNADSLKLSNMLHVEEVREVVEIQHCLTKQISWE